ncbi:sodium-dependent transporter, partial [bacterium]|nr:sodium-dependent transporter [bacterium]
ALLLLGIPVALVEWTMGRYGGQYGHGSAPGIFHRVMKHPIGKYIGVLGIVAPLGIVFYYIFIETWTFGFMLHSITGAYSGITNPEEMQTFLNGFIGVKDTQYFPHGISYVYILFLMTCVINFTIIYFGVSKGIERFCLYAMPTLFISAVIMVFWVLTLKNPDNPAWTGINGLKFMWKPDFTALWNSRMWLEAAGQIFFTLSVGCGVILSYSSYVKKDHDIAKSALQAASMNEFAEVCLGGTIIIPAAFVFFGASGAITMAKGGTFHLGFITMPLIFNQVPTGGSIMGFIWFMLLFFAAITSSISLLQPAIAFLEDELKLNRKMSVIIIASLVFTVANACIFFPPVVDDLDFWLGSFGLVFLALLEIIIFIVFVGVDKGWKELNRGSDWKIPALFKWVVLTITPIYLLIILGSFFWQRAWPKLPEVVNKDWYSIVGTRCFLIVLVAVFMYLVHYAWKKHHDG